ncbi:MAG: type II secretion system F family protein [Planctomycetia bacterium]|nr:type II secretion system F family protein [Planctomycetia bacterium]
MTPILIMIAVFIGVAALVVGLALVFRDRKDSKVEDRLDMLAGLKNPIKDREESILRKGALEALSKGPSILENLLSRFMNPTLFLEQANVSMSAGRFFLISVILAAAGGLTPFVMRLSPALIPVGALFLGALPIVYLVFKRKRRLKMFATQLPDAMELVARALRAGHSLASGLSLVAEEMPDPIGREFGRAFEEQNLGIPLEETLKSMTERVPNMDLRFFCTAVILQRQTGGDLAEILDKIGSLVRERFKIWGQVQALTGEGRLSGIVLLALPPLLFLAVYYLNQEYIMLLFTDEMGRQMLMVAVGLQVLGALVIRKIVNIKV